MDIHLNALFTRFQEQFFCGHGLGPSSGTCLLKVDSISHSFIKSLFKASAGLFRANPWKRLRSDHHFGIRIGKETDWTHKKQPFACAHFTGGDSGDLGFIMFRSQQDADKVAPSGSRFTNRVPGVEVLRLSFEQKSFMHSLNRHMVRSLSLDSSGPDRYPSIEIAHFTTSGGVQFRNPTLEELKFVYAFMRAIVLVYPLLQEVRDSASILHPFLIFEPFIETVDVQWPPEIAKGDRDSVAATISHPPGQVYEVKTSVCTEELANSSQTDEENKLTDMMVDVTVTRQCLLCKNEINGDQYLTCGRCKAVIYCGSTCQKLHLKESHSTMCELYKAMMEREEELSLKIFAFPCIFEHPCHWLENLGLHQKGMWRRKCNCFSHFPFGLLPVSERASEGWFGLGKGEYPPNLPFVTQGVSCPFLLSSWSEYYTLRSLPLSSPIATILSHPLTVYAILTIFNIGSKKLLLHGQEVTLHYIGPECELDWMPAFAEIGYLLNGTGNVQIIMVGPEVPSSLSGAVIEINEGVRVHLVKGIYQEEATNLPTPRAVVALNCGLKDWEKPGGALELIKSLNVPAFFSDQSELSCANAKQVLREAGLRITLPVTPNPFRSPVKSHTPSTNLPSFGNGFLFGVNT